MTKAMKSTETAKKSAAAPAPAMKPMKAMKKRVSKIAKGNRAKSSVFRGSKMSTKSGLTTSDLTKNTYGKIVSKKKSELAKTTYAETIKRSVDAVRKARKALNLKGFVPVGGKSPQGKALYAKARQIHQ